MNKGTKIALVVGTLALASTAGYATYATAGYGKGGWHKGGHSQHWRGHKGWRIERMLERFDTNEDGKLTQEELNKARGELLERHDADKDGELNLAEFEKLWLEVMRKRMVRGFQRIDTDGNAQITLDEFIKPYAHAVERMDRNDDGAIGRDDRKSRHGHHRGGRKGDEGAGKPHRS